MMTGLIAQANAELPDNEEPGAPPPPKPPTALTVPELRHLCELLLRGDKIGFWDQKTDSWTYPTEIRRKLLAMLAAMEGQAQ